MLEMFDTYIAVDWSAKNSPSSKKPTHDAIWVSEKDLIDDTQQESYWPTRFECASYLEKLLIDKASRKRKIIIGYDFDFGFPYGFAESIGIQSTTDSWKEVWNVISTLVVDNEDNRNNRFEVASYLNSICKQSQTTNIGPFWGHPINQKHTDLYYKSPAYPFITAKGKSLNKYRRSEMNEPKAQSVWKLIGSASVGGQSLMGIPTVSRLRWNTELQNISKIWPFETGFTTPIITGGMPLIVHIEIWPGVINNYLDRNILIRDQAQVRIFTEWLSILDKRGLLPELFGKPPMLSSDHIHECINEEGWVFGTGYIQRNWMEVLL